MILRPYRQEVAKPIFDYAEWREFLKVVEKAKIACINAVFSEADHFVYVNKMVLLGRRQKEVAQRRQEAKGINRAFIVPDSVEYFIAC
jgi:hypothetical protein